MSETIIHFITFLGSLCFLIASLGLYRMPDAFSRIHAATKSSSLGVLLLLISAVSFFQSIEVIILSFLILFLVFMTAPLACHCISSQILKKNLK